MIHLLGSLHARGVLSRSRIEPAPRDNLTRIDLDYETAHPTETNHQSY